MNILITGYTSKIGYAVIPPLLQSNQKIYIAGRSPLIEFPSVNWIPWSLGQKLDPTNLPKIDVVIHLAWQTKFRRKNFHSNIGGSLQSLNDDKFRGARVIFVSSMAALNPITFYGLAKRTVEKNCSAKDFRVIRPGLVLEAEKHTNRLRKLLIIPAPKTPVYLTHLDCLVSHVLKSIFEGSEPDRNIICQVVRLSDLVAKNLPYIPIAGGIDKILLRISPKSEKLNDALDAYKSLVTTPILEPNSCKVVN